MGNGKEGKGKETTAAHSALAKCRCCQAWNARVTGPWTLSMRRRRTITGAGVGAGVGPAVGSAVGLLDGSAVGEGEGSAVGPAVGSAVGLLDGSAVGAVVGASDIVAFGVGASVAVGACVEINQCVGSSMAWRSTRRFRMNLISTQAGAIVGA